jgi:hypothetical protein
MTAGHIVADDVDGPVVTSELKITMVRGQPAIKDLDYLGLSVVQEKPPRRLLVPVSRIAFDPDSEYTFGFAHYFTTFTLLAWGP